MNFVKCFDVFNMIFDDANERFAPLWKPSEKNMLILQQYCSVIDQLSKEFIGIYFDISVDEITMEIHIELGCRDISSKRGTQMLLELASQGISFKIYPEKSDLLGLHFMFPSIWERTTKGGC